MPAAGSRTQFFRLIFTELGNCTLAHPFYSPPPQDIFKSHNDDVGGGYEAPPSHDDHDEGDGYTDFFDLGRNSVNLFGF